MCRGMRRVYTASPMQVQWRPGRGGMATCVRYQRELAKVRPSASQPNSATSTLVRSGFPGTTRTQLCVLPPSSPALLALQVLRQVYHPVRLTSPSMIVRRSSSAQPWMIHRQTGGLLTLMIALAGEPNDVCSQQKLSQGVKLRGRPHGTATHQRRELINALARTSVTEDRP